MYIYIKRNIINNIMIRYLVIIVLKNDNIKLYSIKKGIKMIIVVYVVF